MHAMSLTLFDKQQCQENKNKTLVGTEIFKSKAIGISLLD